MIYCATNVIVYQQLSKAPAKIKADVLILVKMQLGLAKSGASLQPKRELVRPVQNI